MDPQETWRQLLAAWRDQDWQEVLELSSSLLAWMRRGGFPPAPYPENMGRSWNLKTAYLTCNYAKEIAQSMSAETGSPLIDIPFALSCSICTQQGPASIEAAVKSGWKDVAVVPNSIVKIALGHCPVCIAKNRVPVA